MGLLTVPMAELKRRVEKRRYARMVLQRATTTTTTPATFTEAAPVEEGEGKEEKSGGSSSRESTPSKPGKGKAAAASPVTKQEQREREQLWVNRYSPSAFPHLLSDEAINREVTYTFCVSIIPPFLSPPPTHFIHSIQFHRTTPYTTLNPPPPPK